jgi:hypothetical protein
MILKIISGGQTGADRGGLEAARACGVEHGGWCPRGRLAEDGVIPADFHLTETKSAGYPERTEKNVIEAHCTVIFTFGPPTGGSKKTRELAGKYGRPCLCVDLAVLTDEAAARLVLEWLSPGGLMSPALAVPPPHPVLNVAGSRESKSPGLQKRVAEVMRQVLKPPFYPTHGE